MFKLSRLPFIIDEVKIEPPSEEDIKPQEEIVLDSPNDRDPESEPCSSQSSSSFLCLQPSIKFTGNFFFHTILCRCILHDRSFNWNRNKINIFNPQILSLGYYFH